MLRILYFFIFLCITFTHISAHAISVIRDTEIESVLVNYVRRIFNAAGLNPDNAQVVLVNDESVNAFVAGGQTIFVHTGLITQSKYVDDLIFVLSHETGHIVGGHVVRGMNIYDNAQTTALISTILGGLVAIAGRPDAGLAVMMGGTSSAVNIFSAYRQTEESSADRIAVDIMNKTRYSMKGFENTMNLIQAQERLSSGDDFSYIRTHPISRDRLKALARFTQNSLPVHTDIRFELIKAKLIGFLNDPNQTLRLYQKDNSLVGRYARTIALYRLHRFDEAHLLLDSVINEKNNYPYFYELKGQFYLETGQLDKAIFYYQKAIDLMPNAPLMRLSLGQALLEQQTVQNAQKAIPHLKYVLLKEKETPYAWKLLATAYQITGQTKEIPYVMAEYYRTMGDMKNAKRMAQKAIKTLSPKSVSYQHAQDILALPEN